jgi:hypothetical protein
VVFTGVSSAGRGGSDPGGRGSSCPLTILASAIQSEPHVRIAATRSPGGRQAEGLGAVAWVEGCGPARRAAPPWGGRRERRQPVTGCVTGFEPNRGLTQIANGRRRTLFLRCLTAAWPLSGCHCYSTVPEWWPLVAAECGAKGSTRGPWLPPSAGRHALNRHLSVGMDKIGRWGSLRLSLPTAGALGLASARGGRPRRGAG